MRGRVHTREFKLTVVRQIAQGDRRPAQVCREHQLTESLLLRWRREYDVRGEAAFSPREVTPTEALERKVADLERFCGQLAHENALLKKAVQARGATSGHSTP